MPTKLMWHKDCKKKYTKEWKRYLFVHIRLVYAIFPLMLYESLSNWNRYMSKLTVQLRPSTKSQILSWIWKEVMVGKKAGVVEMYRNVDCCFATHSSFQTLIVHCLESIGEQKGYKKTRTMSPGEAMTSLWRTLEMWQVIAIWEVKVRWCKKIGDFGTLDTQIYMHLTIWVFMTIHYMILYYTVFCL